VQQLGGQCERCGYDENLVVFSFHHRDESEKSFVLDLRYLANQSRATLEAEIQKYALLCENCHAEVHHPELDLTVEMDFIEESG
jgi:hypothetical protein